MAELKTKPTKESVNEFIGKVAGDKRRQDCRAIIRLMTQATGAKPEMWGPSIVGFGRYHYKYESGREADWMMIGFSPRKTGLTLYLLGGFHYHADLMKRLGKHQTGKGCLYLKTLDDVDLDVLRKLVDQSVARLSDKRIDRAAPAKKSARKKAASQTGR